MINQTLAQTRGNRTTAAEFLGRDRPAPMRKRKGHNPVAPPEHSTTKDVS